MTHEDDWFYSGDYWYVDPLDGWNRQIYVDPTHTIITRQSSDGANAAAPPAGAQGSAGQFVPSGDPLAWLNPINMKVLLNEARDNYIENNDPDLRKKLEEYVTLIEAYQGRAAWNDLTEIEQFELNQMAEEMQTLLHRLGSNLDYFGNPAGWVPMLSFEVNRTIFDNEIDRSIEILYLSYWLKNRAADAQQKVDALAEAREKTRAEIEDAKARLTRATELIPSLQIKAGEISNRVYTTQLDLAVLEQKLQEQAEENLEEPWWKTGLKIAGTLCSVIPVGQPALGAIGGGMNLVANFNPDNPWSSITGAADIASTFATLEFRRGQQET